MGISVYAAVLLNLVMNAHFYPSLLKYQGGSEMADLIEKESLDIETIYKVSDQHSWALDFYFGKPLARIELDQLPSDRVTWVYADDKEKLLLQKEGVAWDAEYTVDQFRISRLQARFLNPGTRAEILRKRYLLRISPME